MEQVRATLKLIGGIKKTIAKKKKELKAAREWNDHLDQQLKGWHWWHHKGGETAPREVVKLQQTLSAARVEVQHVLEQTAEDESFQTHTMKMDLLELHEEMVYILGIMKGLRRSLEGDRHVMRLMQGWEESQRLADDLFAAIDEVLKRLNHLTELALQGEIIEPNPWREQVLAAKLSRIEKALHEEQGLSHNAQEEAAELRRILAEEREEREQEIERLLQEREGLAKDSQANHKAMETVQQQLTEAQQARAAAEERLRTALQHRDKLDEERRQLRSEHEALQQELTAKQQAVTAAQARTGETAAREAQKAQEQAATLTKQLKEKAEELTHVRSELATAEGTLQQERENWKNERQRLLDEQASTTQRLQRSQVKHATAKKRAQQEAQRTTPSRRHVLKTMIYTVAAAATGAAAGGSWYVKKRPELLLALRGEPLPSEPIGDLAAEGGPRITGKLPSGIYLKFSNTRSLDAATAEAVFLKEEYLHNEGDIVIVDTQADTGMRIVMANGAEFPKEHYPRYMVLLSRRFPLQREVPGEALDQVEELRKRGYSKKVYIIGHGSSTYRTLWPPESTEELADRAKGILKAHQRLLGDRALRSQRKHQFKEYYELAREAGSAFDVDRWLIMAVMEQESLYDPEAISHAAALGLMQVTPTTWQTIQNNPHYYVGHLRHRRNKAGLLKLFNDPFRPKDSIYMGAAYLSFQLNKWKNRADALAAYNAGEGTVQRVKDGEQELPGETQQYIKQVPRRIDAIKRRAEQEGLE